MLCISMRAGDYFTVGGSTVVQFDRLTGDRVHLEPGEEEGSDGAASDLGWHG